MKKILKKKKILFPLIFFSELTIIVLIAIIFNFETENSLYGVISIYILFGTFVWFLIRIIKDHKSDFCNKKILFTEIPVLWGIYFVTALLILILIVIAPFAIIYLFS